MNENPHRENNRKWQTLTREQRRIAGVLVEKSKTTPDVYPMTVNSITAGANQKSNRSPLMTLTQEQVERVLDQLRELGVVIEVHGDGRAIKYKHTLYDWLGVDKVEMAVMAELLLRGQQTLGELRQRASRMEPVDDLEQMKTIVQALVDRELMLELTPAGRGQVVSHNLYNFDELKKIRAGLGDSKDHVDSDGDFSGETATFAKTRNRDSLESRLEELERVVLELSERIERLES